MTEREICLKIERMVGYVPPGTTDLLKILTHPDMIKMTHEYVEERLY